MINPRYFLLAAIAAFTLSGCGWTPPEEIAEVYDDLPEAINFNYHVKPILSDKCFACHGPDAANQQANLRLDLEEFAFASLESNSGKYAFVPGKPGRSEAVLRMLSKDEDYMMPPPGSHLILEPREIAIITKWVEQGAAYKPHWSFLKPVKNEPPHSQFDSWATSEIDQFV
ncbi:MAG TPA: c-type cytochrome domain-containing protein, partial [Lunatimonas sp.]|nr:c-type cytochrome domain-containing protein [Lunatimonas sp.]